MSPSRVGRCVNPERDEAGSPAFVRALAVAYPERWTALYREYRSIVEPTHMTQAGSDDRALRQAEILAEIARIEDVMVRELRHLLKKARALINMQ